MSGSAGLRPAKKRRRGVSVLKKHSQSLGAECAGPVVGPAVRIVKNQLHFFKYDFCRFKETSSKVDNLLDFKFLASINIYTKK